MIDNNSQDLTVLGGEIKTLCKSLRRMLRADTTGHETEIQHSNQGIDALVETQPEEETCMPSEIELCKLDLTQVLGKQLSKLNRKMIPESLSELLDSNGMSTPCFTSSDYQPPTKKTKFSISAGDLIFYRTNTSSEFIVAQALDSTEFRGNSSTKGVRLAIGMLKIIRTDLRIKHNIRFTGLNTELVMNGKTYVINSTIARTFRAEILNTTALKDNEHVVAKPMSDAQRYDLLKPFFCNTRTGGTIIALEHDHHESIQIILNCYIILHHWIRHDLKICEDEAQKNDQIESIAYSIRTAPTTQPPPLTYQAGDEIYTTQPNPDANLFSIEQCINDWKCLWVGRIMRESADKQRAITEFNAEIEKLKAFEKDPLLPELISFDMADRKADIPPATEYAKTALKRAIDKTIGESDATQLCTIEPNRKDIHVINYARTLFDDAIEITNDIRQTLLANSIQITHMSQLRSDDFIMLDTDSVVKVTKLTLVDPFLSEFISIDQHLTGWREKINIARNEEQDDTQYLESRMKSVLCMLPDNKNGVALEVQQRRLPNFKRKDQFYKILAMQLTYEKTDGQTDSTLDFSKIRLIGYAEPPKVGTSTIGGLIYTQNEQASDPRASTTKPTCEICHGNDPLNAWIYTLACGHLFHEKCGINMHLGYTPRRGRFRYRALAANLTRCPVCKILTYIQRKGADASVAGTAEMADVSAAGTAETDESDSDSSGW